MDMWSPKMKAMQGMSFLGMLFYIFFVIFVVMLVLRIGPVYLHNKAVKDAIETLAKDPQITQMPKEKLRDLFLRKLQVNDVKEVSPDALVIEEDGKKKALSIHYETRVHLFANIDCVMTFDNRALIE